MQLFSADATMHKKFIFHSFCPWKHEKNTLKSNLLNFSTGLADQTAQQKTRINKSP